MTQTTLDWKGSIHRQRRALAAMLHEPMARLAERCAPLIGDRKQLNEALLSGFPSIPYRASLYVLGPDGIQLSDTVTKSGIHPGNYGLDRSQRPYMKESVPGWGFLLSDAYIGMAQGRPSLTALHVIQRDGSVLGYLGANFDLRDLPVTAELYEEPGYWRQVRGDPAIRGMLFLQTRVESSMDRQLDQTLSILEELLTERGVFQCIIHFSSSQAIVWLVDDPFRYRILDHEALMDPDICLVYPFRPYPRDAVVPAGEVGRVLRSLRALRFADETIYLRTASLNLFNGMISLTFSCDGSHYMPYVEFLLKDKVFWFGPTSA